MSDYIKREDAIRQIVKTSAKNELDIPAIGTVIYILSEMDSADVRENVRGEWLQHTIDGNVWSIDKDTCSVCKETFYQISETGCVWNFCPNCGADMRGEA